MAGGQFITTLQRITCIKYNFDNNETTDYFRITNKGISSKKLKHNRANVAKSTIILFHFASGVRFYHHSQNFLLPELLFTLNTQIIFCFEVIFLKNLIGSKFYLTLRVYHWSVVSSFIPKNS